MIGLGGGSFADFLAESFPKWLISVVEIDPVVIRLARRFFPLHKRIEIIQADGRRFLVDSREKYDLIIMDAFGETFIPAALYTQEYFSLMKSRLNEHGLLLMNTWENALLDVRERATLQRVFSNGFYIHHPRERPGNRIYVLGDDMEAATLLKQRISRSFVAYGFPGEAPQFVLAGLQPLHGASGAGAPITDANVGAVLKQALGSSP